MSGRLVLKQIALRFTFVVFITLLVLTTISPVHADGIWTNQTPTAAPSARTEHAMASIGGDKLLLFDGYDGSVDGETWVYDLSDNNWIELTLTGSPSPRFHHTMASPGKDQVILFGGYDNGENGET